MPFDAAARTEAELATVEPALADKVRRVLAAMAALGFPMVVIEGRRSAARQALLYAQGRTKPGPVVTHADGVQVRSRHQSGRAADCTFVREDGADVVWGGPWAAYGACAEAVGLRWGGRWAAPVDRPHVELPPAP